jgi:hypothetical protein
MNKILLCIAAAIAVVLVGLYFFLNGRDFVVTIPEETIREKLNEKLPLSKRYLFIFDVSLDNPRVDLDSENNRIVVGLDVVLNIIVNDNEKPLGGSVDVSGTIEYISEDGAFYLSEPIIERLLIEGLPEKYASKASIVVEKALTRFYSNRPVYTLNSSDVKQVTAKMILKDLVVKENSIVLTLGI